MAGAEAQTRVLSAPAKLNLGLRLLGRRPDGVHLLESLFVPLDLADRVELHVEVAAGGSGGPVVELELEGRAPSRDVPTDETNLAAAAARAFLDAAGLAGRVRIRLRKEVPVAAGLGGGSSDAGAVLRGLAELFPDALPSGEIARLAAGLGADVPFFLDPRPALVTGIGEQVEPVDGVPELDLVLANPGISLATAEVYAAADALGPALTPARAGSTLRSLSELQTAGKVGGSVGGGGWQVDGLAKLLVNDLEPAALRLCPSVGRLRDSLRAAGAAAVGMSGSGATVYGIFRSRAEAESAIRKAGFELQSADFQSAFRSADGQPAVWARVVRSSGSRSD
ncbi:MAG: 4-(cytidine 5'-diphospho)-2-C-methyl-D-erythritol kinase [Proteobacteria bacterium]|nr:4-(cytidine 5'-diphospho)-2-C-methyl-D-erythritol kinase [Pseudomonadota bacterium]